MPVKFVCKSGEKLSLSLIPFSLPNDCTTSCCRANWTHWTWPPRFVPWTWTGTSSLHPTDPEFCTTSWLVGFWLLNTSVNTSVLCLWLMFYLKRVVFLLDFMFFQVTQPHMQSISPWTKPQRSCAFCSRSTGTYIRGSPSSSRWLKT